jgi:hypothetical protein
MKSLNGWPVIPAYGHPDLVTLFVPGTRRRLTLDKHAAPLLIALAADYHAWVRPIDVGPVDEGGYNHREATNAPGQMSNHASGTAVDINWAREGRMGSVAGRSWFALPHVRYEIARMKVIYGPVVTWGGDWRARDYCHWEISSGTTPAQVAARIKYLGITPDGVRHNNWRGKPL